MVKSQFIGEFDTFEEALKARMNAELECYSMEVLENFCKNGYPEK